ncbi:hypothetical protein ASPZODRAFT_140248 [Penicilliopsis zonata CBS 506.65]|uniref:Mediator of RNA polymerase II transcription subunit 19 n=1 Tax=Penicilliopsis zonata CBS 506.65 TaxID=1073090 RepID=A0A1L9SQI2_9EURO|nr:hypothetical protein ASPZODRAFT_140248 [Penicilliopsis zonata CBS 506.65]OJJ49341.1 hypothetical protein ASPZODRAFT_140248 [Penicilliopsis zonata CBS 506.65]
MSNSVASTSYRVGPPSPPSPPAGSLKEQHSHPPPFPLLAIEEIPQTPTSPPLMSVSAENYASNITSSQTSPSQTTAQPTNFSSPPSSAPMSTQTSQQPTMMTVTNSFPTPASSVSGHGMGATAADDLDHSENSFPSSDPQSLRSAAPTIHEHRRTDHDRHWTDAQQAAVGVRDFANSGGREDLPKDGDAMDVDKDTTNPNDSDLASLQKDFTSAFHLCKSSYTATGPNPSLDLISLYGLGPVANSVARIDAVTGEKINRLRKSYEGKLKGLGLAGRNKPVKLESGASGGLRQLMMWPEEEWQNQQVYGKQIKVADMDTALYNLQMKAMKMEPGPVPNSDYWEDILGHEKPSKQTGTPAVATVTSAADGKKPTGSIGTPRPNIAANGTPHPAELERSRPSRGRKRHYDDNSFAGYGEGYADDDDDGAFYSNGEGIGKKKRKKDHVSKVSTPIPERGGSYGVGMFGIGAR